jgi:primosomal protein N' (replication factor Y) (superfamily II helicase)
MHEPQKFARVVIASPFNQPLIYNIPEPLQDQVNAGFRVLIPLQRRTVTGVVLEMLSENPLAETREIVAVLDDQPILDPSLLKLAHWLSHYYVAPLGAVLATMLPPTSRRDSKKTIVLKSSPPLIDNPLSQQLLDEIGRRKGKIAFKTLARRFPGENIERLLASLAASGRIEIQEQLAKQRRKACEITVPAVTPASLSQPSSSFELTASQNNALRAIGARLEQKKFETFLLHGVTGSGKTEVYLRAIEQARLLGKRSLILIPEISLTPQLLDRVNGRFPGRVGVLHSALTAAERWSQWWQILRGYVDVVIGARSAVFAPIENLGLIVIDEEHDPSYKQQDGVLYNGRDVAIVRGKFANCPVLLGSATPALESYENCRQGRYCLLEIPQRVEQRPLPTFEIIDLRAQEHRTQVPSPSVDRLEKNLAQKTPALFSHTLIAQLRENFANGRQTLIFLNRRGFANFLQCVNCGYVWRCPYCSVTLTFHRQQKTLACHHCEYRRPVTQTCPECKNDSLKSVGAGTEQVEAILRELLPEARIARMDRDTTSKRGSQEALIRRWEKGEIDVLVGTQMITKGHDVSGVTLVGALLADLSLNLPDFRAAERTFQLLSQVGGRSGRGANPGRVIIQTYAPDHYALKYLVAHDYQGFFAAESEFRRMLNYPPNGRLVHLRIDGPKISDVEQRAQALAAALRQELARATACRDPIEVLGPAPAPIERLRNRFRWQILLKGKQTSALLDLARQARSLMPRSRAVRLHIDVDPYSML